MALALCRWQGGDVRDLAVQDRLSGPGPRGLVWSYDLSDDPYSCDKRLVDDLSIRGFYLRAASWLNEHAFVPGFSQQPAACPIPEELGRIRRNSVAGHDQLRDAVDHSQDGFVTPQKTPVHLCH